MGKGANNGKTRRFDVRFTPEIDDFLEGLAKLGLYGGSKAEVVRYFVKQGLERILRDRVVAGFSEDQKALRKLKEE